MSEATRPRWLLLIHQIPPRPNYLRVKIGRRLQGLGAVAIKNSVYVLPGSEQALEDFQWVRQEIVAGGGEASVCESRFLEGLSDARVEALFGAAREADYAALIRKARRLQRDVAGRRKRPAGSKERTEGTLARLRKRLAEVVEIDFFGASGRETAEALVAAAEAALRPRAREGEERGPGEAGAVRGRTWVTRSGVHIDRMACAWLVRRFIDTEARFKFVRGHEYTPQAGELRFDMFEAEFTHEGELCTFEVLLRRFGLNDPALREIAEIVHDIDLKDGKFARREAAGAERLVAGIAMRHEDDAARLNDAAVAFEALYAYFRAHAAS